MLLKIEAFFRVNRLHAKVRERDQKKKVAINNIYDLNLAIACLADKISCHSGPCAQLLPDSAGPPDIPG